MTYFEITDEFQFPSNGKVEPKHSPDTSYKSAYSGFNSLQTGKWSQSALEREEKRREKFQFPSNGKV